MARPIDPTAKRHIVSTRVNDETKGWLMLWRPQAEASTQLADVIERAQKFWPQGPDKFGREIDPTQPARTRLSPAVSRAAAHRGMEKAAYINAACRAFETAEKDRLEWEAKFETLTHADPFSDEEKVRGE